ncbi:MAG TPA: metal ABC transporter permease [Tepidisphaeraceae bacterium]|jgi:manganese/iron transport system permease protein|nr:metal ABC transporter permease [Tepidisphaeraceae bacterium]
MTALQMSIITASAIGLACAALSVFVILRRWAFIGEGIAHAGFGGAGTAWVLSLLLPGVAGLRSEGGIYCIAAVFCLGMALVIGCMTRREHVYSDTAIGIVLVASLAWGFLGLGAYIQLKNITPPGWGDYVLGQTSLRRVDVMAALLMCGGVLWVLGLMRKEIVAFCFDAEMAEVGGVRVGVIHYVMILLVTTTILLGMRLMGSLLVAALLVLPGAIGLQLSRRMSVVVGTAVGAGLIGAVAGPLINHQWGFIKEGPAIVLVLVMEFGIAYLWRRTRAH